MRPPLKDLLVPLFALLLALPSFAPAPLAQSGRGAPRGAPQKKAEPRPSATPTPTPAPAEAAEDFDDDAEAVRVETDLVTVPVIVSDREGRYVPDLKQEEFNVWEDGAPQQVAFFATITEPFHVVLMLDMSASTTVEKLRQMQGAAVAFVGQLNEADRVKVISFDDEVRDLCEFTGDRTTLRRAIEATRPGQGTRLYDAFDLALRALRRVRGRKAVVLLTDGVDWRSASKTYDDNRRALEESDVIVYPVRFDTRAEVEQLVREQQRGGQAVDLGTIFGGGGPSRGPSTPTTFPGGTQPPQLPPGSGGGLPGPVIVSRRGGGTTYPPSGPAPNPRDPHPPSTHPTDSTDALLDLLYRTADQYLSELARTSGGRLLRADVTSALTAAFSQVAEELRTQYSLGYYPTNKARDGKFRKLRVRASRKDVSVRARPGYLARK